MKPGSDPADGIGYAVGSFCATLMRGSASSKQHFGRPFIGGFAENEESLCQVFASQTYAWQVAPGVHRDAPAPGRSLGYRCRHAAVRWPVDGPKCAEP